MTSAIPIGLIHVLMSSSIGQIHTWYLQFVFNFVPTWERVTWPCIFLPRCHGRQADLICKLVSFMERTPEAPQTRSRADYITSADVILVCLNTFCAPYRPMYIILPSSFVIVHCISPEFIHTHASVFSLFISYSHFIWFLMQCNIICM